MIVIPRENPVFENLNSSYLRMDRFVSHLSEEVTSGCIHFKSYAGEGALFFGEDSFLSGFFNFKDKHITGSSALKFIRESVPDGHFSVSVFRIAPERFFYWANLRNTEILHNKLSSDIMELGDLVRKMCSGKLTGVVEILVSGISGLGNIYFINGEVVGSSATWEDSGLQRTREHLEKLGVLVKKRGGSFTVRQITMKQSQVPEEVRREKPALERPRGQDESSGDTDRAVEMLQKLLVITENTFRNHTRVKHEFEMVLKKKFVAKVSEFDFLDPFAADFIYTGEKVSFSGSASGRELIRGVVTCVKELASEYSVEELLRKNLSLWVDSYSRDLKASGMVI